MSDISLLMTDIFLRGQQPPKSPTTELHRDVQAIAHLSVSPSPNKITISAPEFLQLNNKTPLLPLRIQPEIKKILSRISSILTKQEFIKSTIQPPLDLTTSFQGNRNPNPNATIEPIKAERLRSQLVNDGSVILARYSSNDIGLPVLRFGSTGIPVRALQRLLASNGYRISVDGKFGALTEAAVKAFQTQQEIGTDGIVGQVTWTELTR